MEAEILESFFAVMGRFPLGVNSFEKSENYRIENDTGSGTGGGIRRTRADGVSHDDGGEVFYADYAKPEGLCDEAWKAIYQYVFALAHGADKDLFYYGDWIRKPGVAICSCNDGLRPVIFKLETTGEEAEISYTPVR